MNEFTPGLYRSLDSLICVSDLMLVCDAQMFNELIAG